MTFLISVACGSVFGCEELRQEDQWYLRCYVFFLLIEGSLPEMCFEVLNRNRLPKRLFRKIT